MIHGYSVCFNEWALDKSIKSELGLLLIISGLTAEKGYCYASNEYFAKKFNLEPETISRRISKLKDKGYIKLEFKKEGNYIKSRKIRLTKTSLPLNKNVNGSLDENVIGSLDENVKENITSINNTRENNTSENLLAFQFLKTEYPTRFEQEFQMKFYKSIKNKQKFVDDFNSTVEIEELKYEPRILFARLSKYARNWAQNEKKFSGDEEETVRPYSLKRR